MSNHQRHSTHTVGLVWKIKIKIKDGNFQNKTKSEGNVNKWKIISEYMSYFPSHFFVVIIVLSKLKIIITSNIKSNKNRCVNMQNNNNKVSEKEDVLSVSYVGRSFWPFTSNTITTPPFFVINCLKISNRHWWCHSSSQPITMCDVINGPISQPAHVLKLHRQWVVSGFEHSESSDEFSLNVNVCECVCVFPQPQPHY